MIWVVPRLERKIYRLQTISSQTTESLVRCWTVWSRYSARLFSKVVCWVWELITCCYFDRFLVLLDERRWSSSMLYQRIPQLFPHPPTAVHRFPYFFVHYITNDWPACCRLSSSSRSLSLVLLLGCFFVLLKNHSLILSFSLYACVDVRRRKNDRVCSGVGQSRENYQIRRSTRRKKPNWRKNKKEATAIADDLSMCAWVCAWTSVQTSRQTALL